MVASRFQSALFSRPWMPQVGAYPGAPPAAPAAASMPASPPQANQPLQVMAGAVPAAIPPFQPPLGQGEGYGGGGLDPNTTGYGTSPDFGSWAANILAGTGLLAGPIGAAIAAGRIGGTMIADPARATPYGSMQDVLGLLGWGGPQAAGGTPFGGMSNAEIAGMPTQGFADATGLGSATDNALANALAETVASVEGGYAGDLGGGTGPGGAAAGTGTGTEDQGGTAGIYRYGGYTGAGKDGVVQKWAPAGTVHEGEVVMSTEAVRKHGRDKLERMNADARKANRLASVVKRMR